MKMLLRLLLPAVGINKKKSFVMIFLMPWLFAMAGILVMTDTAAANVKIPAGEVLYVRLVTPVSSYSAKAGDQVRAILIAPIYHQGKPVVAEGCWVEGQVREVHRVGMGFHHETARLAIVFNILRSGEDEMLEIFTEMTVVENAREEVQNGIIKGIRATFTPQGRINSRLIHLPTWNPYSDTALMIFKASFPIFPEPEIYLKPGTDLSLRLTRPLVLSVEFGEASTPASFSQEDEALLQDLIQSMPTRVMDTDGKRPADWTNLLLIGTETDIRQAFSAAGWIEAEPSSFRAFWRNFSAFLSNSAYPNAPMAEFRMNGRLADLNYQKGFNSYASRHHLRIWKMEQTYNGQSLWLASATHDIGASLSLKQKRFYHRVDPYVDQERAKIVRDLSFAGSLSKLALIPRKGISSPVLNGTGEHMATDGLLAVLDLQSCRRCQPIPNETIQEITPQYRQKRWIARYFRSQILTYRNDFLRANIIYGAWDLSRLVRKGFRRNPAPEINPGETAAESLQNKQADE